ncbi:hypothetical protein Cantr_04698 [Candida viswanathii]|uniref:Zn(2)-C6 fungal-type domain-containing protein n=1 Tax=Candida viswanathii TaxID=5486 RepID=A0A367XQM1_9ASCO|nr:hypothetical protein Cantr_04698 [Candida viswanathii]
MDNNLSNLISLTSQSDPNLHSSSSSSNTTTPNNGITQPTATTTTTTLTQPPPHTASSTTTSSTLNSTPELKASSYPPQPTSDSNSTSNSTNNASSKPKRQRRSYSCGPCKLLKIKCDLQIPCTACKKFKRINRCLLQPPQPPSEQELNKIKERKKRSNIKKMRLSNDFVQTYNTSSDCIPSLASSIDATSLNLEKLNRLNDTNSQSHHHHHHDVPAASSSSSASSHTNNNSNSKGSGANPSQGITHSMIQIRPRQPRFQPEAASTTENYHSINFLTTPTLRGANQTTVNFNDDIHSGDIIASLTALDAQRFVDLTMVDIKRIKRLLPNDFAIFETLAKFYLNSINPILVDLQDYPEMMNHNKLTYHKLLAIDDENPKNLSLNVPFSLIELRHLSLFFLILANGFLFDFRENTSGGSNFLLEKTLYKPKQDVINDWIKISKFIKVKVLSYESLTDVIFLMDWYLIAKNFFDYNDMMVESYLEFNNLLNYLVLNNEFISTIEDPHNDAGSSPAPDGKDESPYPESKVFKVLAKYWIQIRLIEIEFTFFQFKGSLLLSNQLKNTVVPHKKLLDLLYKQNELDSISKSTLEVWGLYYRRSRNTTSIRGIIKDYLQLYSYIHATLKNELKFLQTNLPPPDSPVTLLEVELLIKNQRILLLFIKWLSFIRIESNYFPSLRYTSYLTTIMNLFNHFNYLNSRSNNTILSVIMTTYSTCYMKHFYQCLAFQGLFLVLLKNAIGNHTLFKIDLPKIYRAMLQQFQSTLNTFMTDKHIIKLNENVTSFGICADLTVELNKYIEEPKEPIDDLTDLIYDLKPGISDKNWDFLIDYFFGSRDNFARYIEKIWDLLQYLKIEDSDATEEDIARLRHIPITQKIELNDKLIDDSLGQFYGFEFDTDVVNDYVKHCVEPNIQD